VARRAASGLGALALALAALAMAACATHTTPKPQGGAAAVSLKIVFSCVPHEDLSVSDCRVEDSNITADDPLVKRALKTISSAKLHADWKTTLKRDGERVLIPMTMAMREVG
jgi:hypothetical protein